MYVLEGAIMVHTFPSTETNEATFRLTEEMCMIRLPGILKWKEKQIHRNHQIFKKEQIRKSQ
jgi:hypothetical protein